MMSKQYLNMADIPDFPGFETPGDIDYLKSTPETWSDDYRRVFKSEQTAKRNTTRMFMYSKNLLGLLVRSIESTDELVAENERLREFERDATRYRFLLDNCTTQQADSCGPIFVMTIRQKDNPFNVGLSIDEAMNGSRTNE